MAQSELFEAVKQAFATMDWACEEVPGREVIRAGFEAYHTRVELHVQVFEEAQVVSVVSQSRLARPGDRALLNLLAELLMRTNCQLTLGAFEMNWDSGEVIFRVSNVFSPRAFESEMIASMVHSAVAEVDRVTPFVRTMENMPPGELSGLDVAALMEREDLLPAPAGGEEDEG